MSTPGLTAKQSRAGSCSGDVGVTEPILDLGNISLVRGDIRHGYGAPGVHPKLVLIDFDLRQRTCGCASIGMRQCALFIDDKLSSMKRGRTRARLAKSAIYDVVANRDLVTVTAASRSRHHHVCQGFITATDRSSKCLVLRVAGCPVARALCRQSVCHGG